MDNKEISKEMAKVGKEIRNDQDVINDLRSEDSKRLKSLKHYQQVVKEYIRDEFPNGLSKLDEGQIEDYKHQMRLLKKYKEEIKKLEDK